MKLNRFSTTAAILALGLGVAACGTGQTDADAQAMDEALLGEADNSDPALTTALEDQIMVDQELAGQSNANAALPGDAVSGVPIPDTMHSMADAQRAIAQGRLLSVPAPTQGEDCTDCSAGSRSAAQGETTLGALAQRQASEPDFRECPEPVVYGMQWASALPRPFSVYPGSEVIEAAGKNTEGCRVRVVSFRTAASMDRLLDWYYTRAVRSGYSSEHQLRHGDHVLGGYHARDEGAYYIIFAPRSGGGTDVDIIANNGI
ncbi:hypothetical protein [Parasphingopyxis marina]|uniref:Lipoprotein n=1 Tax=Parasphingopyxis marina TaxID=2761622 RepID=A0A842HU26_9SPHN|nr:hypothetical protein [Parasphingopyxis marina]MBC2776435.1 hypothetical protein [Parasphingopyxis marina]